MCAASNHSSSNITEIEAFEVHHWPIVRGYADRIGLVKVINDLVPTQYLRGFFVHSAKELQIKFKGVLQNRG